MQVSKWGDSLVVRLPNALVEKKSLKAGDELNIVDVAERTLVVQKEQTSLWFNARPPTL
jgi:antitoxin MazE